MIWMHCLCKVWVILVKWIHSQLNIWARQVFKWIHNQVVSLIWILQPTFRRIHLPVLLMFNQLPTLLEKRVTWQCYSHRNRPLTTTRQLNNLQKAQPLNLQKAQPLNLTYNKRQASLVSTNCAQTSASSSNQQQQQHSYPTYHPTFKLVTNNESDSTSTNEQTPQLLNDNEQLKRLLLSQRLAIVCLITSMNSESKWFCCLSEFLVKSNVLTFSCWQSFFVLMNILNKLIEILKAICKHICSNLLILHSTPIQMINTLIQLHIEHPS